MWRSVFLHEFLDSEIRNFQALPGNLTPSSLALSPRPNPPLRTNTVQIIPGRGFEYTLTEAIDEVIGISGRVRLRLFTQGGRVPIMRVGDQAEFQVEPFPSVQGSAPARTLLRIGTTQIQLGVVRFRDRLFTDIRFEWHTSGQARLLQDGRLVGYHNALSPTAQLDVANIVFGLPNAPSTSLTPHYEINRVFVRVLRRSDSLAEFSRLLPDVKVPDDEFFERCRLRAVIDMLARIDRLRAFMATAHQTLSQPWSLAAGPPAGPFSPEAITAHDNATAALVALGKILRSGDFSTTDDFLTPFETFLRILRNALPNQFKMLAVDLSKPPQLPDECMPILEAVLEQHRQAFGPLLDLLSKASERVSAIAEGS